ncbi:OsmC family protein [Paracoccus fistulariae]|uniref:OsmC family protein n=1 Tax=Paracoccus fistulariae TaxID=658446 RepID=A0ABY7SN45_9RHOB|nr:OsmC family protein [Paracoccus fistulariae]MDB6180339.1 OsmC family protein [Paracoccus fistulariae]WCR08420.1 OsmC family protein [Paracoccus fistulariae]
MAGITRKGSAKWHGSIKEGTASVSTQSGALSDQPYGFNTRFEDKPGTNPEELIGAAHASCFSMALSLMMTEAGIGGIEIETTSAVTLEQDGEGFTVTKVHLTTKVSGDGDKAKIEELTQQAKAGCPISKLMKAEITMDATVA